jgi:hypothetical protein
MARILLVTDAGEDAGEVVYSERVGPVHLQGEHAGRLLVERLAWALEDARAVERRRLSSRIRSRSTDASEPISAEPTAQPKEQIWIPT